MAKPTYTQIARAASVGPATVERVLNGRGGVRAETVEKVLLAARKLDWPGRLPDRHQGIIRIEVILVRPDSSFFARLAAAFRRISATLDPAVQIHLTFLDEDDPEAIVRRIENPNSHRSGLVIATPGSARIRQALTRAQGDGLPIVQVVTRNIAGSDFVGIDNRAVGRMAGRMVSRLNWAEGRVIALCHSQVYQVHRDRIAGFSEYFRANPRAGLHFDHVLFGRDEADTSAAQVAEALRTWPDIVALYNCGGGNRGVLRALETSGRDVFFVGHELTEVTERALARGTADVIFDQLPEAQARRATDLLLHKIGLTAEALDNPPIRFTTLTADAL
ncbi:LacI family DNA-binding transcriptional regulator [Mesobacterium pallidum]|uniref:LacI family DNA-binding transcriptional regulator n=1 Tax=Mesobacterium pallidum TaxID=2872037 RepID=UPI001EE2E2FE|nr:LacI family DNA-binding transcriptional regulator [Mesobacterium pallidum]